MIPNGAILSLLPDDVLGAAGVIGKAGRTMTIDYIKAVTSRVTAAVRELGDYGKQDNPLLVATQAELNSAVIRALEATEKDLALATERLIDDAWRKGAEAEEGQENHFSVETEPIAALWWYRGYHGKRDV